MMIRRTFLKIAAALPVCAEAGAVVTALDDKKAAPETIKLFIHQKDSHKLELQKRIPSKNIEAVKVHLRKLGMVEKDLKSVDIPALLKSEEENFNNIVSDFGVEVKRPIDERETCPVFELQISPEIIKEQTLFIKFGYPLLLTSDEKREIDISSCGLVQYVEDLGRVKIERDVLFIKFNKPNRNNPKNRDEQFLLIPLDVPVYIIKDKKLYFIDVRNPLENPEKIRNRKFA